MKPVQQTRFGYPEGNCLMACAASILEVPLEDLPDLFNECCTWDDEAERWRDGDWWNFLEDACWERGYHTIYLSHQAHELAPQGYHIAGVDSPRETTVTEDGTNAGHVVVCLDGEIVHDPHPSGDGLAGPIKDWILLIPRKDYEP